MHCVKSEQTIEDTIKKSRFIGVIAPCSTETEANVILQRLNQQHPNASHIAFAYRIKTSQGIIYRFNDAGEPSGTAGKPILHHLEGKLDLINSIIAVVRYFGGTKLGAGGLTRAYGHSAKKAIEAAQLVPFVAHVKVNVVLDYARLQNFEYQLQKLQGEIIAQQFEEKITLSVSIPESHLDILRQILD